MENKLKTISIVLASVAAVLLIALVWVYIDRNGMVKQLQLDKDDLTEQLVQVRAEYDSLTTTNDSLMAQLDVERERVDILIEKVQKTEATNRSRIREYEKELGTLRSIMRSYIQQIDSLNYLTIELRKDAANARAQAREQERKYEDMKNTADEYAKKVEVGSALKGRNFSMVGINESNKDTDRSSRTIKLKACFSIIENSIANKGPRKIYVRIKGPDGILLTNSTQGVFVMDGEQYIYSAMREIDYQGEEIEVCVYFGGVDFTKGVYKAEVYSSQGKMGEADLLLK